MVLTACDERHSSQRRARCRRSLSLKRATSVKKRPSMMPRKSRWMRGRDSKRGLPTDRCNTNPMARLHKRCKKLPNLLLRLHPPAYPLCRRRAIAWLVLSLASSQSPHQPTSIFPCCPSVSPFHRNNVKRWPFDSASQQQPSQYGRGCAGGGTRDILQHVVAAIRCQPNSAAFAQGPLRGDNLAAPILNAVWSLVSSLMLEYGCFPATPTPEGFLQIKDPCFQPLLCSACLLARFVAQFLNFCQAFLARMQWSGLSSAAAEIRSDSPHRDRPSRTTFFETLTSRPGYCSAEGDWRTTWSYTSIHCQDTRQSHSTTPGESEQSPDNTLLFLKIESPQAY